MRLTYIITLVLLFSMTSCGDDGSISGEDVLNYDGENATSPTLPPGTYVAAVRFPMTLLRNLEGRSIKAISLNIYEPAEAMSLIFANDESPTEPGTYIFQQDISNVLSANSWNTITLSQPVNITGDALWVGLEFNSMALRQTIGCDAGPSNVNGDWLYDSADQQWDRFENRVGESINWNIRAILGE